MQPIARNEVLPIGEYEQVRPHFRARVIEAKKVRRLAVGQFMSATFENRDTVLLQIQEMLRTERITNEEGVLHEIETYNELLPAPGELSMTFFVEIADKDQRERTLTELAGLESAIFLEVAGERVQALAKDRSVEGIDRTTAVHYFKLPLTDKARAALVAGEAAALVVDHKALQVRSPLPVAVARSLAVDLS